MKRFLLGLVIAASSVNAWAYDFSAADAAYEMRENNPAKIREARAAYLAAFNSALTTDESIYAIEQASRLDAYETGSSTDNDLIKRVSLACYDNATKIAATAATHPAYTYWRATCLGIWGRANGVIASLSRSGELVDLIEAGIKIDPTYEGGGFHRLGSAVYAKLPAINPFGPRGDVNKALEYINLAIASAAHSSAIDPETSTGDYFYNAYQFKAEALAKLGRKAEAIEVLNSAIARINGGDLPVGREAETRVYLADLQKTLADLQ